MKEVKVIFHVDEMGKWNLVLKNVGNLLHAINVEKSRIEVLANSEAVEFYKINGNGKDMKELNRKGVSFVACNNALNNLGIKKEELFDFVEIVPVGVLEIINREEEGYGYIKP